MRVAELKRKLELFAGVEFIKDVTKPDWPVWTAVLDGEVIARSTALGDCILLAAKELGE